MIIKYIFKNTKNGKYFERFDFSEHNCNKETSDITKARIFYDVYSKKDINGYICIEYDEELKNIRRLKLNKISNG